MLKVKVISLPYIFKVLYVLCFTRPRYQVSVYRTIGPLVSKILYIVQGLHRPGKVLEFDLGPGKLLEFENSAICPGNVLEF